MPSLVHAFLLLALLTFVLAAPAPGHIQKRSFKVERVPNPKYVRCPGAGTRAMIKAYRKYSIPLPPGLVAAMNEAQKGKDSQSVKSEGVKTEAAGDGLTGEISALEGALEGLTGQTGNVNAGPGDGGANQGAGNGNTPDAAKATVAKPKPSGTPKGAAGNGTVPGTAKATGAKPKAPKSTGSPNGVAGNSTGKGVVGLVTATPEAQDVEYLSPVNIGGQIINMNFDSGSSDLWVFNTQLPQASQAGHQNFDISKSTTFKMMQGAAYSISYGDGSGSAGNVGTDTVNIGGATVTSQAIELATAVSDSFVQDQNSNGLVGLAFSKLNTVKPTKQKTFFDNAMPSLAEPVFTADLRSQAVGSYEFGRIDSAKFNGSLSWTTVNTTQGFWQFTSDKLQVGNSQPVAIPGGQAIADTGTTLMLMNQVAVDAYYSQVNGAVNDAQIGGVTFPCAAKLPDMNIAIGNNMAVVRGSDINFAQVDNAGTTCFGGVQTLAGGLQIYGDIMFKSQFVVFNGGNNSLGFAPHQ